MHFNFTLIWIWQSCKQKSIEKNEQRRDAIISGITRTIQICNLIFFSMPVRYDCSYSLMRNWGKILVLEMMDADWSLLYCTVALSMKTLVKMRFCALPVSHCMLNYVARTLCLPGQETSCCLEENGWWCNFPFHPRANLSCLTTTHKTC